MIACLKGRRPLWLHGVSVGEVQAVMPLVKAARDAGYSGPVIISTTTETGKAMALRLGGGLFDAHIYYPWDKKKFVRSAIKSLDPWAFAAAETELWPNMLWEMRDAGVKTFLVNGRISDRTWARLQGTLRSRVGMELYGLFNEIFLRGERDAFRLESLGIPRGRMHVFGDSKIDALLLRKNQAVRDAWAAKLEFYKGPIFMAGSTHTGEDEIVLAAFKILRKTEPDSRLIIAPRHPERAAAVEALSGDEFATSLLSEISGGWEVLVVDQIGVLFELYGVAAAAFIGGSFVDKGGQNILEPVSWGVPVQYGPHMEDFAEASAEFLSLGIAAQADSAEKLGEIWTGIAAQVHNDGWDRYRDLSAKYFAKASGAARRTWAEIGRYWQSAI